MPLSRGTRLGPYEILTLIGAGGMGQVYKARDTRLHRTVAIKVPAEPLNERFRREASAIAALNHPRICTLYDVGKQDDLDFLVMEYVEGETLATRLEKGPLPVAQALELATQLAEALHAAHRRSIVHRDLKPGNIMLTKGGVKLLDFGLAKIAGTGDTANDSLAETATRHSLTSKGTVLGTLPYIAPEQLEGKDTDTRADLFALGAVIYEMISGRRAFKGESPAITIAAIMNRDPTPLSALQPESPPRLNRLVEACLAKDPENRWQSARDVMLELQWISDEFASMRLEPVLPVSRARSRNMWLGAAALVGAAIFGGSLYLGRASPERPTFEFDVAKPSGVESYSTFGPAVAVSPDGRSLVLRAVGKDGNEHLWLRAVDSSAARELPGTAGAVSAFWSFDSRFIAFVADGKLSKIDIRGGLPTILCAVGGSTWNHYGGTWNRNGDIVFGRTNDGLYQISDKGGPARPVTRLNSSRQETSHDLPHFLPDGRRFLFTVNTTDSAHSGIYLGAVQEEEARLLIKGARRAVYTAPHARSKGYVVFDQQRVLMAQAFDPDRGQLSGEPFAVATGQLIHPTSFSASDNGVLAYRMGTLQSTLTWMNRQGQPIASLPAVGDYRQFSLSPDDRTIAVSRIDGASSSIWLMESTRGTLTRLTSEQSWNWCPLWSPDGHRIAFSSQRGAVLDIYQRVATGEGKDELTLRSALDKLVSSWSPDGRFLAYWTTDPNTRNDIWVLPILGKKQPFLFLQTAFNELHPAFSPDGHWLAHTSDESGRQEVYVRQFRGVTADGRKWRISAGGGSHARWSRDGKELFYLAPDRKLMSAEIQAEPEFSAGAPRSLFQTSVRLQDYLWSYAVAANGRQFLLNNPLEEPESGPVTVVAGWKGFQAH